jgi:chorismate-pyruvate lyase
VRALFAPFPDGGRTAPPARAVLPAEMPQPYRRLLVHHRHMTVALEQFHHAPVTLRVLAEKLEADSYSRKILLLKQGTDRAVEFGILRVSRRFCGRELWDRILEGSTPLGRILASGGFSRRVEPRQYLEMTPSREMQAALNLGKPEKLYGRLAAIFCEGRKTIEVLEVLPPEPAA